ncbi:MAG: C4-type zinc ribbon domain-containing protein [Firmicutes bacterium]|nr:C4-type zinc ribbon domain-containing protein [Bacillota bacterium]
MSQLWHMYRLSLLDQESDKKNEELRKLKDPAEIEKECKDLEKEIARLDEESKKLVLATKKLELESESIKTHWKSIEKKLYSGKTSNTKELSGWQTEVATLKKKQNKIEEEIIVLMEQAESIDESLKNSQKQLELKKAEAESAWKSYKETKVNLEKEIAELKDKRTKLVPPIDQADLKKYEMLRKLKDDGVAIVKIEENVCGGCYMSVPDMMIKKVQTLHLVTCNNCSRILYWEDEK